LKTLNVGHRMMRKNEQGAFSSNTHRKIGKKRKRRGGVWLLRKTMENLAPSLEGKKREEQRQMQSMFNAFFMRGEGKKRKSGAPLHRALMNRGKCYRNRLRHRAPEREGKRSGCPAAAYFRSTWEKKRRKEREKAPTHRPRLECPHPRSEKGLRA